MKMVSAAKLRRAQEKVLAARPYSSVLREMMASILGNEPEDSPTLAHPLLARRKEERILVLLLTGDKGLCGAFNSNVIRRSQEFLDERSSAEVEMELIGRKGRDFYRRRDAPIAGEWINIFNNIDFPTCQKISDNVIARFTRQEVDAVYLIFNEFKSVLRQTLIVDRLLPVQVSAAEGGGGVEYLYEQPAPEIFRTLLPRYVSVTVYQAMLESAAAEHAARMTAMDAATRNAEEMIDKLTLHMNRVRQASITKEIIEVVSGAAGLE